MRRRIFFVTSGRLAAYEWDGGRLADPLAFGADEAGLTQFSSYLESHGREPVHLLVDVVEEEFREETIPHVLGADRRALIRSKLGRLFRDSTYTHAIFQQRETEGRRDDRMLFTALIRPEMLAPWVSQLARHKVPLAGIYSVPAISRTLLKPLGVDNERALVVTMQSSGALRQTFFAAGQLKLSRLAVMPNVDPRGYASYVLGEVEKLRRYLNSLRLLPHDSPLDVYILGPRQLLHDIERQSPDSLTTRHHAFALEEFAGKLGVKGHYDSPYADRMFAHLLARKPPANQYAPESQTRYFTFHQARQWMKVASVLLVAGSVVAGGLNAVDGVIASGEAESLRRQASFYEERYRVARERLPSTPAESRDMKQAVDVVGQLARNRGTPYATMLVISHGLGEFPLLQLDRIDWLSSNDREAVVVGDRSARRATSSRSEDETESTLYQLAHITGRIDPFDGNYRNALDLIGRFAERLRTLQQVAEVQVVALPLDVGSEARLSGDASVEAISASAPFELRLVLEEPTDEAG